MPSTDLLFVIDWRVVNLTDPRYDGKAYGNVVLAKTGSISLTLKGQGDAVAALAILEGGRSVTVNNAISITADSSRTYALSFAAEDGTLFDGTVNFGSTRAAITARANAVGTDSAAATGIRGANLTFANRNELSNLTGNFTVAATSAGAAATAAAISAGQILTIYTGLGTSFSVTATAGKGAGNNFATSAALAAGEIRLKNVLQSAIFTINATGGKEGTGSKASVRAIDSTLADIEIAETLAGSFNLNARGGTGGNAGAEGRAIDSARDLAIGAVANTLRITVNATGGTGSESGSSASAMTAGGAIAIGNALYTFWTINATGGKGGDAGASTTAMDAASIAVEGRVSGTLYSTARGGSNADSADAEAAGFRAAGGSAAFGGTDRNFRMTLQASGGTAAQSAEAAVTGIEADAITFTGDALGNYTLNATGGTAAQANAVTTGWRGASIAVGGGLGGAWTINATGGRGGDAGASTAAMDAASITVEGWVSGTLYSTARGGSNADNADAEAAGFRATGGSAAFGGTDRNFRMTLQAFGGTASQSAEAAVTGIEADAITFTGDALGNYTLNATGGTAAQANALSTGWSGGDITVGGELGGSWTLNANGSRGTGNALGTAAAIAASNSVSLGKLTANVTVNARGGSNAAKSDASAQGIASEGSISILGNLSGNWYLNATGGQNNASTGTSATAYAAGFSAATNISIAGTFAGNFNLNVRGGSRGDGGAEGYALQAGGVVTLGDFVNGARFYLNVNGGTNGTKLSARAIALNAGAVKTGAFLGTHTVNAVAGTPLAGGTEATAFAALLYATGPEETVIGKLSGSHTVTARGGANGSDNRAQAFGLAAGAALTLASIDKAFRSTVNATGGNNGVTSAAQSVIFSGGSFAVTGEFAGTYNVNATGGQTQTGAAGSSSAASGCVAYTANSGLFIGSFGQTALTVTVRGGSNAINNDAAAYGFYAEEVLGAGAILNNFRLTVNATGGNGSKVATASSQEVSANATARAFATETSDLSLTGGFAGIITVNATAGTVNSGGDTSAVARANAFFAGVTQNSGGSLTIGGAIAGTITVNATSNNASTIEEDKARAVGFEADSSIVVGSFASTFRFTASAVSIGNAGARAFRSGDTLTIARLDGIWSVTARAAGTYSSGNAVTYGVYSSRAVTIDSMATTLQFNLTATGGNSIYTGNAFTESRIFHSGSSVTLANAAGSFTINASSNKAIYDSYSLGYFIYSVGASVGDFDSKFKLKITTRGGTSYNGDGYASSYGIFGGTTAAVTVGALAGSFDLAASAGVGSAAAISSTPQKVGAGSAAATAIGITGKGVTLAAIETAFTMKLVAKAGVSAVGNRSKTASAESRAIYSKDGALVIAGKVGGSYNLSAYGGVSAAGSANPTVIEPSYIEYAAANATSDLFRGNSVTLGVMDSALKLTALAVAGSASSEAYTIVGQDADSQAHASAAAAAITAEGALEITRLAGNYSLTAKAGSASAVAYSRSGTPDKSATAYAEANASAIAVSGDSVTLAQIDAKLRIVVSAAAGSASSSAAILSPLETATGVATATAKANAFACGIQAASGPISIKSNLFGGLIAATATGGKASAKDGTEATGTSYGLYSAGGIYGEDASHALVVTGVIASAASTSAFAIYGNGINITVNGALYAGSHTNAATVADALAKLVGTGRSAAQYLADALKLNGNAYAVKGGAADDIVAFGSGSISIGNIDLGGGSNTLSLTHQSQIYGDILSSDGGVLEIIINIGGESSANPIITVGSDAGKTLGSASVSILIDAAVLGSYTLVKNGGDFSGNTFTVNGISLTVGSEIRLANGTYVSLHIDSKNQLIFTASVGHNPYTVNNSQVYGAPAGDPDARALQGGAGDDLHLVRNTLDTIAEASGGGTDTAVSGVSYELGENVENLFLHGKGDLDATGNAGNNRIAGNSGNNILDGGGGDDTFIFSENWGHDLVRNDGGTIELLFTDGIRADDLNLEYFDNDLRVTHKLTGDTIWIENGIDAAIRFGNDLYYDNYLLRDELGCFATLESLSEQNSTKNAMLA